MGSSSSRLRSGAPPPQVNRTKQPHRFSSLLCVCSSYDRLEMENNPAESSVSSVELDEPVFDKVKNQNDDFDRISGMDEGLTPSTSEAGSSSEISTTKSLKNSGLEICFQKGNELISPVVSENCTNGLDKDKNTTSSSASFIEQQSPEPVSQHNSAVANGFASVVSDESSGVSHGGNSHPENDIFGDANFDIVNNEAEVTSLDNSTSTVSLHIDLPNRSENSGEMVSSEFEFPIFDREQNGEDEDVVLVDVLSIPTGGLSSMASDTSSWESRQNNRSFLDVFADHSPVDNSTESQIVFSADESDYMESRERWLFGHSDLFSDERVRDGPGFLGSRIHRSNQRHRHRRYEIFDRLRTGLSENNIQTTSCPSGIHPDGECSCDRSLTDEISSAHQSISRIVMLAEALFEVLDELHHQPTSFSLAIASDTASTSVIDSLPLKSYQKIEATESIDSVEQCNICFAEYDEGDKIRVLPCHHEYHMVCVDKWLKEIHGICPLCRGDVREIAGSDSIIP